MIDTNNLLTAGEVAKKLKVTVQSVRLLIKNGILLSSFWKMKDQE